MQMAPIDGIQNVEVRLYERLGHAHIRCRSGAGDCNEQSREGLAVHRMRKNRGSANVHWSLPRPQGRICLRFRARGSVPIGASATRSQNISVDQRYLRAPREREARRLMDMARWKHTTQFDEGQCQRKTDAEHFLW